MLFSAVQCCYLMSSNPMWYSLVLYIASEYIYIYTYIKSCSRWGGLRPVQYLCWWFPPLFKNMWFWEKCVFLYICTCIYIYMYTCTCVSTYIHVCLTCDLRSSSFGFQIICSMLQGVLPAAGGSIEISLTMSALYFDSCLAWGQNGESNRERCNRELGLPFSVG